MGKYVEVGTPSVPTQHKKLHVVDGQAFPSPASIHLPTLEHKPPEGKGPLVLFMTTVPDTW